MTKFYTRGATRMYSDENIDAWIKAEENLGLKNSIFFHHNGTTDQWIDADEGEKFFKFVTWMCKDKIHLDKIFEDFFEIIKKKDKIEMFESLAIFNEIDEHPEIATEDQLRRLKRIRESTHEEIYKMSGNENTVQNNKV